MNIVEFLEARIAEDEKRAHYYDPLGASIGPARLLAECQAKRAIINLHDQTGERWTGFPRADQQEHYCIHDQQPAPCPTLRVLASVYADHSDYREEWKP